MLGLRFTTEAQPRLKNGSATHTTTGVASRNCSQTCRSGPSHSATGSPRCPPISSTRVAKPSGAPTHKRRRKSTSSGLGPASAVGIMGSRAMPQIGQSPGASRTISGSIGHVYFTPSGTGWGSARGPRNSSGEASKRVWQRPEQK